MCWAIANSLRFNTLSNNKEKEMYGVTLGAANVATGVAVLPNTGDNKLLFGAAIFLLASGVIILIASTVSARKNAKSN